MGAAGSRVRQSRRRRSGFATGRLNIATVAEEPLALSRHLRPKLVALGFVTLVAASLAGIVLGPIELTTSDVIRAIADRMPFLEIETGLSDRELAILWQLRIPRVVLGGLVGATLAVAGAAYQGVFRNPLADPYLLGVAAGAGLGATFAFVNLGNGGAMVPVAAFVGGVLAVVATYLLGQIGSRATTKLVLAGVAVASFFTAAQTYVQQRHADDLRLVYSWILGRLATTGWNEVGLVLPYIAIATAVILAHRRLLDTLAVGEAEAQALGVPVRRVRLLVVAAATLGSAAVVAVSGLIGFVGIIVPHTVRLLTGESYRSVLPLSLLFGAAFLIATDLAARTIDAPAELPVGVVTAFFGAPFFLAVLQRAGRAR
ncbi:MAG: FecCD family ABC transporter permease [Acidimicrobiia bacterium]